MPLFIRNNLFIDHEMPQMLTPVNIYWYLQVISTKGKPSPASESNYVYTLQKSTHPSEMLSGGFSYAVVLLNNIAKLLCIQLVKSSQRERLCDVKAKDL